MAEQRNYFHFMHRLASGEIRDVEVHSSPVDLEGGTVLHSIVHDTTALREAESKYRTLVEGSLSGVFIAREGVFVYANPKMAEIFGFSAEELTACPISEVVVPGDRSAVTEFLLHPVDGSAESLHSAFRGRRRDGTEIDVEVLCSLMEYGGTPRGRRHAPGRDRTEKVRETPVGPLSHRGGDGRGDRSRRSLRRGSPNRGGAHGRPELLHRAPRCRGRHAELSLPGRRARRAAPAAAPQEGTDGVCPAHGTAPSRAAGGVRRAARPRGSRTRGIAFDRLAGSAPEERRPHVRSDRRSKLHRQDPLHREGDGAPEFRVAARRGGDREQARRGADQAPRVPRSADGSSEPAALPGSPDPFRRAGAPRRRRTGRLFRRSRPIQGHQRLARPLDRRSIAAGDRGAHPGAAVGRRHPRAAGGRRVHSAHSERDSRGRRGANRGANPEQLQEVPGSGRPGAVHHREHRREPVSLRRPRRRDARPKCRHRDVPGQRARPRQLSALHAGAQRAGAGADEARERRSRRASQRRVHAALPASDQPGDVEGRGSGGSDLLEALAGRPHPALGLHSPGGGDGPDPSNRRLGASNGLPAAPGMARRGAAFDSNVGEPVGAAVPAAGARVADRGDARRRGPRSRVPRPRNHREYRDGQRRTGALDSPAPQESRPRDHDGRFRDRVFVAGLSEKISARHAQDRPGIRSRDGRGPEGRRGRAGGDRSGARDRPSRDRGGGGNRGAARDPSGARLRRDAGISLLPADRSERPARTSRARVGSS